MFPVISGAQVSGTLRSKVRSGLLWTSAATWAVKLFTLGLFAVLARILEPEQFGLFAAVTVVITLVEILSEQGISDAVVQRREITEAQLNATFFLSLACAVVLFAVIWTTAPFIAEHVMKVPALTPFLRANSVVVLINALGFAQAAMHRRAFGFRLLSLISIVSTVVSGVVGLGFALGGWGTWSLIAQTITSSVVVCLGLWTHSQWKLSFDLDMKGLREIFRFSLHSLGARLLDFGGTRYVEVFIVSSLGSTALGFYLVGMRTYSALVQVLSNSMRGVAYSAFAELANDNKSLCEAYYKTTAVAAVAAVPAFVLMAALAPELISVIFGPKWQPSIVVANSVALFGAVQLFDTYNGAVLNAIGKPSVAMRIAGFRLVVTIAIFLVIQPQSLESIVYLSIGIQLAATVIPFIYLRRTIGLSIRRWVSIVAPSVVCCTLGYLAIHAARYTTLSGNDFVDLFVLCALGLATVGVSGLFIARQQILSTARMVLRR